MALCSACPDLTDRYDRLAPDYDRLHRRWLRHAGGEAQAALEAAVRVVARPEMELLDAGCGTGAFVRRLHAEGLLTAPSTLLDASGAMLARCADLPAERVQGRLERLPFPNGRFDIVTCAWSLETASDPDRALAELCRVVRPGGMLCLAFCAEKPVQTPLDRLLQAALSIRGTGRFLNPWQVAALLGTRHGMAVRSLPCHGPAAALLASPS